MKLDVYLKIKNIRNSQFAKNIGISRNYIELIISGKRRPGVNLAAKIQDNTDGYVSVDELLFPFKYKHIKPDDILKIISEYEKRI